MHDDVVGHEIPVSGLVEAPLGCGTSSRVHFTPFHRSAKPTKGLRSDAPKSPTATQSRGDLHDTSFSSLHGCDVRPLGARTVTIVQRRPSHASASAVVDPSGETAYPTALQNDAELHDTPWSVLASAPWTLGAPCRRHDAPFQRSTMVCWIPSAPIDEPTAVHELNEVHETFESSLVVHWWGSGRPRWTGLAPSQVSASADRRSDREVSDPTTTQRDGDVQETPVSDPAAEGVRTGTTSHTRPTRDATSRCSAPEDVAS